MMKHTRKSKISPIWVIIFSTLLFQNNHLGISQSIDSDIRNETISKLLKSIEQEGNSTKIEIMENLENAENFSSDAEGSWAVVASVSVFLIIAPYLSLLRLRFYQDQPLNKQSITTKLYQDCNKIGLLFMFLWASYVIAAQIIADHQNSSIYLQLTTCIVYANEGAFFLGSLYAFLIGSLRLYTTCYQILDPLEEWFGGYEDMAILSIRLILSTLVIFYIGIIFFISATPILYHKLANQDLKWAAVSMRSICKITFNIAFTILLVVLFATDKVIKIRKDSEAKKARSETRKSLYICCGQKQVPSETARLASLNGKEESRKRNEFSNYISLIALLYIGSGVGALAFLMLLFLNIINLDIWWVLTVLLLLQGVLLPILFLICNSNFRKYCWRQVKGDVNNLRRCIHSFVSFFKKCNDRVNPIQ